MYYRHFRIFFTILSAISIALLFPVGTLFGWGWAGMCGLFALLFFGVMLLFKQSQQKYDELHNTQDENKPDDEETSDTTQPTTESKDN